MINYRPNKIIVIAVLLLFIFVAWYIISSKNSSKYFEIQKNLEVINIEVENIKLRNKELKAEINKLKNDKEYLEDVVRREYGFLKKNEMVFDFEKKKKK